MSVDWIDVASVDAFPPGSYRTLDIGGTAVAVFNVEGVYFAIADTCTHEAETLSNGVIEGREIVCPRHGARFSLLTGAALTPPAYEPVATFRVRVADGKVQVAADH